MQPKRSSHGVRGNTPKVRVLRDGTPEPRLPNDRDESVDSQAPDASDLQAKGRKAYDDVRAGRVDTDRGPVLEELGRRLPPAPQPKRTPRHRR